MANALQAVSAMMQAKRPAMMARAVGRSEDEAVRFQSEIMAMVADSRGLQNAKPESLWKAVSVAWSMRLEPTLKHFYLIPYGKDAELVLGYKGLLELAHRHPAVRSINYELVYEGEDFEFNRADPNSLKHPVTFGIDRSNDTLIKGGYLVAKLGTGDHIETMVHFVDRTLFDRRKKEALAKAKNKKASPWTTNFAEQCFKTIVRDAINRGKLPMSIELQQALTADEVPAKAEPEIDPNEEVIIDAGGAVATTVDDPKAKQDAIDELLSVGPLEPDILNYASIEFGASAKVLDDLPLDVLEKLVAFYKS